MKLKEKGVENTLFGIVIPTFMRWTCLEHCTVHAKHPCSMILEGEVNMVVRLLGFLGTFDGLEIATRLSVQFLV